MIPAVPKDTVVVVEVEVERLVLKMKGHGLILERQMVQVMVAFLLAFTVQQQQPMQNKKKGQKSGVPGMHGQQNIVTLVCFGSNCSHKLGTTWSTCHGCTARYWCRGRTLCTGRATTRGWRVAPGTVRPEHVSSSTHVGCWDGKFVR